MRRLLGQSRSNCRAIIDMHRVYITIATVCVIFLLFVSVQAKTHHKSHNEVIPKHNGHVTSSSSSQNTRWSTYSRLYHYLLKREKPWLLLPNNNYCFKDWCKSNDDCCRGYNICDPSAKICIDCWYRYPCKSSANCCEKYPVCRKEPGKAYGHCMSKQH